MKSRKAKKLQNRIISSVLTGAMLLSTCSGAFAAGPLFGWTNWWEGWFGGGPSKKAAPSMEVVKEIQAYTDGTIYGSGLVEVEITYDKNVDLSDIDADSYILEDRGSLNPDFGQIDIESATVKGQTVTLEITQDTDATEASSLEGTRQRNSFGVYVTGAWYRDENGTILYGKEAVSSGLIDQLGGLSDALSALHEMIDKEKAEE